MIRQGMLSILWLSCALCVIGTFARAIQLPVNEQAARDSRTDSYDHPKTTDKLRDKRALGLILSGLAQVFGYTLNPTQLAVLPNLPVNTGPDQMGSGLVQPASPAFQLPPLNPTQPPAIASSSVAPRQRETIRFTGVVNFGNGTDILNHLQQFERIFHGTNGSQAPPTTAAPVSSTTTAMPSSNIRSQSPVLLKIPLPFGQRDLKLSYPDDQSPIRLNDEEVYTKNVNVGNFAVNSKETYDERDILQPPPKYNEQVYSEPYWRKQYEDRIAELERRQKEHAAKLKEKEDERSREKDSNYNGEKIGCKCNEKHVEPYRHNYSSEEDDNSKEKNESAEKVSKYRGKEYSKDSSEAQDEAQKYNNRESDTYKSYQRPENEEFPRLTSTNYTDISQNSQLPITDYYQRNTPEHIRNSYGEVLDSGELVDDGIANYFGNFKQSQKSDHNSRQPSNTEDASKEDKDADNYSGLRISAKEHADAIEKLRQEYSPPGPQSKYEEYNLNKDYNVNRNSGDMDRTPSPPVPSRAPNTPPSGIQKHSEHRQTNEDPESSLEEERSNKNFEFLKYTPYVLPIRYFYSTGELEPTNERSTVFHNADAFDNGRLDVSSITAKPPERRAPELENLSPKVGLPQPMQPRKLHEGEEKQQQFWPAPFDYVLDSTETKIHSTGPYPQYQLKNDHWTEKKAKANVRATTLPKKDRTQENANFMRKREPTSTNLNMQYQKNSNHTLSHHATRRTMPRAQNRPRQSSSKANNRNVQAKRVNTSKSVPVERFDDPKSAHDFFGFSKDDYGFNDQEQSGKPQKSMATEEIDYVPPEPVPYNYNERLTEFSEKPESETEKVKIKEYSNKVATLKVKQQKQDRLNGPISYIDFTRNL